MTLAQYMEKHNLRDEDVAEFLGYKRSMVCKLRNGKVRPSYEGMLKIKKWSLGEVGLETWARTKAPAS